jgi:outer membrane protein assembly factor BamD
MSAYKYASMSIPDKQRERYLTFVDDYFNVISEYPESQYRKELDGLYAKVQTILKKNSPEENN